MANDTKTVLIIEDEKFVKGALRKKLEAEGIKCIVAKDGGEGLNLALEKHPDLVLLDIVLPVMDGMTVLEKLRQDPWGKNVPIIILTNLSKASVITESKEKGANTFLVKTNWKLAEVVQKVKYELGII
jgi:CheY-like chemotaxis protein